MPTPTPAPTQEECDRAAVGEHVIRKDYDGSGVDAAALPPGTPPPDLPDLPDRPQIEPPADETKPAPAAAPSYRDLTRGEARHEPPKTTRARREPPEPTESNAVNRGE